MPLNFYVIVLAQFIIFLCVYFRYRNQQDNVWKILSLSALFGLVFGISFDIIFGALGSFTYVTNLPGTSSSPWGLTPLQLFINGIFSYGLLVATAYFFVPKNNYLQSVRSKKVLVILSLSKIIAAGLIATFVGPGLLQLFALGVVVITLGELLMIVHSLAGPMLSLLLHRDYTLFLHIWLQIIFVGFLCEIMNQFFPFWVFLPGHEYSYVMIEILIVLFGYVVLVHPMIIFWQLMKSKKFI